MKIDYKELKAKSEGHWDKILENNGINSKFLNGKNGPCPLCSGKDRWRWDRDRERGLCHQCHLRGSGSSILAIYLGLTAKSDFPKLLKIISESLDYLPQTTQIKSKGINLKHEMRDARLKLGWSTAQPLTLDESCPANRYFKGRGLDVPIDCLNLKFNNRLEYFNENGNLQGSFPALIARVEDSNGGLIALHRTYLTPEGSKAKVECPKKLIGPAGGGAIRLDAVSDILGVAEGIETALAARAISKIPMFALISSSLMEKFWPPESVKQVIIWADLDRSGAGERSAHILARKLTHSGIKVLIELPPGPIPEGKKSIDWLDVLNKFGTDCESGGLNEFK